VSIDRCRLKVGPPEKLLDGNYIVSIDLKELEAWFRDKPKWLQDAARRLVQNEILIDSDIIDLLEICVGEAVGSKVNFSGLPTGSLGLCFIEATKPLHLKSIADVHGINALAPSKPLEFGETPLCIVYGRNAAGKSGYVRLLKHACGARRPGLLLGNIFEKGERPKEAKFTSIEDKQTKTYQWTGKPLPELQGLEIYDTACGLVYVDEESEVAFEPWLLRLFTKLTNACTILNQRIQARIAGQVSKKPIFPPDFASTSASTWYTNLTVKTSVKDIDERTAWDSEHDAELKEISIRLAEPDPKARAAALRRQKTLALELKSDLKNNYDTLSDDCCTAYMQARADAEVKRKAADEDAEKVFNRAPLNGIGTKSWLILWEAARQYSEEYAYKAISFPNAEEAARCVLCQQKLDQESRDRFISFEAFVRGELQDLALKAEQNFQKSLELFPELAATETLSIRLEAAGILEGSEMAMMIDFATTLSNRRQACLEARSTDEIPERPTKQLLINLVQIARKYAALARAYDKDAADHNRIQLEQRAKELSARKWLHQQRKAIDSELSRLIIINGLQEADRLTNTMALSKRKSIIANDLITNAYIKRFQDELKGLKALRIKVGLKKTRAEVGRIYHRIYLKDTTEDTNTSNVLSEGEFRIVSLAAFLADTEGRGSKTPFVFDDPISSLDHVYEEAIAQRLAKLSQSRQVIVFTHRLSLVGFMKKYAEKYKIKTELLCLSRYETGKITDLPIDLQRTNNAINTLLNERLPVAKKALALGDVPYEKEAKGLCSEIRILIEQIVEKDLLNEVIRRFNPDVQTKGKIHSIARITEDDCKFIDDYMTQYSRYEHSQPEEAPVELPQPHEIESDLNAIRKFIADIQKRNKS
jgi:hypothetical protein